MQPPWITEPDTMSRGRNMWTVRQDSCAGVTPYCSVLPVEYDISCGRLDPLSSRCSAYTSRRAFRARRGLRDSDRRGFLEIWHRSAGQEMASARRREKCRSEERRVGKE